MTVPGTNLFLDSIKKGVSPLYTGDEQYGKKAFSEELAFFDILNFMKLKNGGTQETLGISKFTGQIGFQPYPLTN